MSELVSYLGARYVFFERWGDPLQAACAAAMLILLWAALTRCRRWTSRLTAFGLCLPALAAIMATRFVGAYIEPLQVPPGYDLRQVSVASAEALLVGDLLTPPRGDRIPAMLFLPGSDVSSYRTNYARLANEVLTPAFASLGSAILYLDKRGVGRSGGQWFEADFEDRAQDARAAVAFLGRQPGIDPSRIIVVGHSQGGWIAQILAADESPPRLAISLAGPTVSVMQQAIDDESGDLACDGTPLDEARRKATTLIEGVRDASRGATRGRLRQFALIADYRPDEVLRRACAPLLLVFGENDRLVPAQTNIERLHTVHAGAIPKRTSVLVLKGATHSLRLGPRCHEGSQRGLAYSPELAGEIRRFVLDGLGLGVGPFGGTDPAISWP